MMDISDLISKKRKYKNLKTNVKTIITKLTDAIENLQVPSNQIKRIYNIDSISVDEGKINSIRENLINKKNYLNNTVLSRINKELNELEDDIESAG